MPLAAYVGGAGKVFVPSSRKSEDLPTPSPTRPGRDVPERMEISKSTSLKPHACSSLGAFRAYYGVVV